MILVVRVFLTASCWWQQITLETLICGRYPVNFLLMRKSGNEMGVDWAHVVANRHKPHQTSTGRAPAGTEKQVNYKTENLSLRTCH